MKRLLRQVLSSNLVYFSPIQRYYHSVSGPKLIPVKHFDLISDFTKGSPERVKIALSTYLELQLFDRETIMSKIKFIQDLKLADQNTMALIPFLLKHPSGLKNRVQSLKEYGVEPIQITSTVLRRFVGLNKMPISKLKEMYIIPSDANVMQNLWKAANLPLETCPEASEEETLYSLKLITLKAYLMDKMDITEEMWEIKKHDFEYRLLNKSFYTMNKNYHVFKDIVQLSSRRLMKNWFILYADADNLMLLLNKVKKVGTVSVKDCLHVYPKVALMTAENLEKSAQYILEAGIPPENIQRTLKVLTLSCETIKARLQELKTNEVFIYNIRHPRILELVHYFVKAKKRLQILDKLKLTTNFAAVSMGEQQFQRLCVLGGKPSGVDCLHYLSYELEMDKKELIVKLRRHPRWTFVPVVQVGRNLQELRKSFSDSEIKKHIYCLFYFSSKLKAELEAVNSREELNFFKENGVLKKEFILPLVLYFLEKESNFSGESVWDFEENPEQDVPDPAELLKSVT